MATQSVATPIASPLWHCPTELTYVAADDLTNVVTFRAASKSRPGQHNTISLDVLTGETLCDCKAAECGRGCWHAELVQAAWDGHAVRVLVGRYNAAQLREAGRKAQRMCAASRVRRYWNVLPADQLMLLACRAEYRRRHPVAAEAVDVAVAA